MPFTRPIMGNMNLPKGSRRAVDDFPDFNTAEIHKNLPKGSRRRVDMPLVTETTELGGISLKGVEGDFVRLS